MHTEDQPPRCYLYADGHCFQEDHIGSLYLMDWSMNDNLPNLQLVTKGERSAPTRDIRKWAPSWGHGNPLLSERMPSYLNRPDGDLQMAVGSCLTA